MCSYLHNTHRGKGSLSEPLNCIRCPLPSKVKSSLKLWVGVECRSISIRINKPNTTSYFAEQLFAWPITVFATERSSRAVSSTAAAGTASGTRRADSQWRRTTTATATITAATGKWTSATSQWTILVSAKISYTTRWPTQPPVSLSASAPGECPTSGSLINYTNPFFSTRLSF